MKFGDCTKCLAQPIRAQELSHHCCILKVCETKTVDIGRASGVDRQKTLSGTKFLNLLFLQTLLSGKKEDKGQELKVKRMYFGQIKSQRL